jgi:hypothetical protein
MTTVPAHHLNWWWRSWNPGGFLHGLAEGMTSVNGAEDIWRVGGVLVEEIEELQPKWSFWKGGIGQFSQHKGYFMWVGGDSYAERDAGAEHLALYLSRIAEISPGEPVRIVAHSHGCNVVKKASSSKKLAKDVVIERAVFLACPHFETHLVHNDEWYYPYRLNIERVGRVLNLFSERDTVQTKIAERLPSTLISTNWREWTPPKAHRTEQDPEAVAVYEDYRIVTQDSGVAAHAALHGVTVGRLAGRWLEGADTFEGVVRKMRKKHGREGLIVPAGDDGEGS